MKYMVETVHFSFVYRNMLLISIIERHFHVFSLTYLLSKLQPRGLITPCSRQNTRTAFCSLVHIVHLFPAFNYGKNQWRCSCPHFEKRGGERLWWVYEFHYDYYMKLSPASALPGHEIFVCCMFMNTFLQIVCKWPYGIWFLLKSCFK